MFSFIISDFCSGSFCSQDMNKMANATHRWVMIIYWPLNRMPLWLISVLAKCRVLMQTSKPSGLFKLINSMLFLTYPASDSRTLILLLQHTSMCIPAPFGKLPVLLTSNHQGPDINVTSSVMPARITLSKVENCSSTNQPLCSTWPFFKFPTLTYFLQFMCKFAA